MLENENHNNSTNPLGEEENFFSEEEIDLDFEGLCLEDTDELRSIDIEGAINNKDIKPILLEEEEGLNESACIIDINGYDGIVEQSFKAIENTLIGGDYKVYIKNGENINGIGSTSEEYALTLIPTLINTLYSGHVKTLIIRKGKVKKYTKHDVSIVRIKLR